MSKQFGARERALTILAMPVALTLSMACSSVAFADTGAGVPGDGTVGAADGHIPGAQQGGGDADNGNVCEDTQPGIGDGNAAFAPGDCGDTGGTGGDSTSGGDSGDPGVGGPGGGTTDPGTPPGAGQGSGGDQGDDSGNGGGWEVPGWGGDNPNAGGKVGSGNGDSNGNGADGGSGNGGSNAGGKHDGSGSDHGKGNDGTDNGHHKGGEKGHHGKGDDNGGGTDPVDPPVVTPPDGPPVVTPPTDDNSGDSSDDDETDDGGDTSTGGSGDGPHTGHKGTPGGTVDGETAGAGKKHHHATDKPVHKPWKPATGHTRHAHKHGGTVILGTQLIRSSGSSAPAAAPAPARVSPRLLPNTGVSNGDLGLLGGAGMVLVLSGGLVLVAERKSWNRAR